MKNEIAINEINHAIEVFRDGFIDVINKLDNCCKIYVNTIDKYPEAKECFKKSIPSIPVGAWSAIEAVGRNFIDKRLLWGGGNASRQLKKLSLSEQKKSLDEGIRVLIKHDNEIDTLIIKPENMTINQVFNNGEIRDIPAQRAYLEGETKKSVTQSYYIKDAYLIIKTPIKLTKSDIENILIKMK